MEERRREEGGGGWVGGQVDGWEREREKGRGGIERERDLFKGSNRYELT